MNAHVKMIVAVAEKLGAELLRDVVLVGGCSTGLLTDTVALNDIRHTEDVDLIVHVVGMAGWYALQGRLEARGFKQTDANEGEPVCAMKCGQLRVDFMPDDPKILGFSNRWYTDALQYAIERTIEGHVIRLVSPVYFLATKLEAYRGRGNGDLLESRDIEDMVVLLAGRDALMVELAGADPELRVYLRESIGELVSDPDIEYAVIGSLGGDKFRAQRVHHRMRNIAQGSFND